MYRTKKLYLAAVLLLATATATQAQVVYRINCGGPNYLDINGDLWTSDSLEGFFNTGRSFPTDATDPTLEIAETDLDEIYRSHRFDSQQAAPIMTYALPVDPGFYSVRLHFADIFWGQEGRRRFNVDLEGEPVLVNYDIVGVTGDRNIADVRQFVTQIVDGDATLDIAFRHGTNDNPMICAIEIETIPPAPIIVQGETAALSVVKNSDCSLSGNRLQLEAVDPDTDVATLEWSIESDAALGAVTFINDQQTGSTVTICYTPATDQIVDDTFTIAVTDGSASSDDDFIDVTVTLIDNQPPSISCPADLTVDADAVITPDATGMATATDDFGGDPTITMSDSVITAACPNALQVRRTWRAMDASGNMAQCMQRIFVRDADSDGDSFLDCEDAEPDVPAIEPGNDGDGGSGDGNNGGDGSNGGGDGSGGNGNGGDPNTDGGTGGGVFVDPITGLPISDTSGCCGGGAPVATPLLLLGLRRRKRRSNVN